MKVLCDFCYRKCQISENGYGWCRVRKNEKGRIESEGFGHIPAIASDPVEKKPLYHFLPGTMTLSLGASGCNLSCDFCQNWTLSQNHEKGEYIAPEAVVKFAGKNGFPSISFTYSEPLVWQDYMLETAAKAKEMGIRTIMVSNGDASEEAMNRILPLLDAFNIDLKGDEGFYRNICHGELQPVLRTIQRITESGKHLEVTTLVIEGIHDEKMIRALGKMLKDSGVSVWHLTRFYPHYKMIDRSPTSELYLAKIIDIAEETNIPYIYPGNSVLKAETRCPGCGKTLRKHIGETIEDGSCPYCGERIYGVWN